MKQEFTIWWAPQTQESLLNECPFLRVFDAEFVDVNGEQYFWLVQELNNPQEQAVVSAYALGFCIVKPGRHPKGSPT